MSESIAIIGAGLIGRLIALRLAKIGIQVNLYDKASSNAEQSAAYVAAAMLAPIAESIEATPLVNQLGADSIKLWQQILPQLNKEVFMQTNGTLLVWHPQDRVLATNFTQQLAKLNLTNSWQQLSATDLANLEPDLANRFKQGIFLPEEGQLDNRQLLTVLADTLIKLGVKCNWLQNIQPQQILNQYDWVIDCRGYGAKQSWQQNNVALSVDQATLLRGVRGEVVRIFAPEVRLNRPVRLLHPRYPLYIAPKPNNFFVIGATQIESEDQSNLTVRSGLELLSALYSVHPAFGEAKIIETSVGLRPTLNHHNPMLRYSKKQSLLQVNGLFRHGFMIAPAVSLVVKQFLQAIWQQQDLSANISYPIPIQALD